MYRRNGYLCLERPGRSVSFDGGIDRLDITVETFGDSTRSKTTVTLDKVEIGRLYRFLMLNERFKEVAKTDEHLTPDQKAKKFLEGFR